jgi:hypothetical protein
LELQYHLPADSALFPFRLSFPDGTTLTLNKQVVRCEISFISKTPICISTPINFFDTNGIMYPLYLHGVIENDLMTNCQFYKSHYSLCSIVAENLESVPQLKEKIKNFVFTFNSLRMENRELSVLDGAVDFICRENKYESFMDAILRFVNLIIIKNPLKKWPDFLIETYGIPLFDVIEEMISKDLGDKKEKKLKNMFSEKNNVKGIPKQIPVFFNFV